jgi:hypothetical protein
MVVASITTAWVAQGVACRGGDPVDDEMARFG